MRRGQDEESVDVEGEGSICGRGFGCKVEPSSSAQKEVGGELSNCGAVRLSKRGDLTIK